MAFSKQMNSNKNKFSCVRGRHMSKTIDLKENEKVNHKIQKIVKVKKGKSDICGRIKSQNFTKWMNRETKQAEPKPSKPKQTKGENFQKSIICKFFISSPISNTAWTVVNSKGDILKLHEF